MLSKDAAPFIGIAKELAKEWDEAEVEMVAGDMIEGFNTSHDLCRIMINAAVEFLRQQRGKEIRNLEFPLESIGTEKAAEGSFVVELDEEAMGEKQKVAFTAYPELKGEVERLTERFGTSVFRKEALIPADPEGGLAWDKAEPPFYEQYGARQIAAGHYSDLITYKDHIQPLAREIYAWASKG